MQALYTLYSIVAMLANVIMMLVVIQFVIGLLFALNVVGRSNQFLYSFYDAINRLLEPVLAPIRRVMPNTGAIDFSPMVLLVLLNIVLIVLQGILAGA